MRFVTWDEFQRHRAHPHEHHEATSTSGPQRGYDGYWRIYETSNFAGPPSAGVLLESGAKYNTLGGVDAGAALTTQNGNTFYGYKVGESYEGSYTLASGYKTMQNATGGTRHVAFGISTLDSAETGSEDCFAALRYALFNLSTGRRCIAIGEGAGLNRTTSYDGIDLGQSAGQNITTGLGSINMGYYAGTNLSGDCDKCVTLGYAAGPSTFAEYNEQFFFDTHATDTPLFHMDCATHVVTINGTLVVTGGATETYVRRDGTLALTANWDAGAFEIRAETFESDIATGTAPFTIASTTVVTNLNADQVDGKDSTDLMLLDGSQSLSADWTVGEHDFVLGTTTGTKIGTAANQKLGLWGATPVIQQAHIVDADGQLADITTKFNTLLSQLEATGILAAA